MKTAYLVSGPRGAGKSTFVAELQRCNPELIVISEDQLKIELFNSVYLNTDIGEHIFLKYSLNKKIRETVESADDSARMILDVWNGIPNTRQKYIRLFKELSIGHIVCWYFVTPLDVCLQWVRAKKDCGHWYNDSCVTKDYNLYHREASDIRSWIEASAQDDDPSWLLERMPDSVYCINPAQQTLPGFAFI